MAENGLLKWRAEVDQQLGVMSSEINGIKQAVRDQGQMLGKIFTRLDEISGKQGPGIAQVLGIVLAGCGIVGAAAGAVTILVTSMIAPQLTRLESQGDQHQTLLQALFDERKDDYSRLKDAATQSLEQRLRNLESSESRLTWAPQVEPGRVNQR